MTNGSSQGLFVIVAVVIFGIFVLISYILFRDNLKTGMSSIFEDSINKTMLDLNGSIGLGDYSKGFNTSTFWLRETKETASSKNPITNNVSRTFDFIQETSGDRTGKNDICIPIASFDELEKLGSIADVSYLSISFNVRSEKDSAIGVRLGGSLFSAKQVTSTSKEWKEVTLEIPLEERPDWYGDNRKEDGYVIFFGNKGKDFEMSDIKFEYHGNHNK